MSDCIIRINNGIKSLRSEDYNYLFDMTDGTFLRWGKTLEDNPEFCKWGPEIADIEVSTICSQGCKFCYKSNTAIGKNMSLKTFIKVFDKLPKTITQAALGIGDFDANSDLRAIMSYCRDNGVIPNITVNGHNIEKKQCRILASLCGAVAVSCYDKDECYNTVQNLSEEIGKTRKYYTRELLEEFSEEEMINRKETLYDEHEVKNTLASVNIHALLSEETYDSCMQLLKDQNTDPRLAKMNAIVFLQLKGKGRGVSLHQVSSFEKYKKLVDYAMANNNRIGFDSCSASNFLKAIKDRSDYKDIETMVDSCESTCFSVYINTDGVVYPCSFTENVGEFVGVNLLEANDFIRDVWTHPQITSFRRKLLANKNEQGCRMCPIYNLKLAEEVYDLKVDSPDSSFIANGIPVGTIGLAGKTYCGEIK